MRGLINPTQEGVLMSELVEQWVMGAKPDSPILKGWRRDLVGEELIALLDGKIALGLDPRTRALKRFTASQKR